MAFRFIQQRRRPKFEKGLISLIACDDVRVERTGKLILVGLYLEEMYVPQFPFELPLMFVALLKPLSRGALNFKLEILIDDVLLLATDLQGGYEAEIRPGTQVMIPIEPKIAVKALKESTLLARCRFYGEGQASTVFRLAIKVAPRPNASG